MGQACTSNASGIFLHANRTPALDNLNDAAAYQGFVVCLPVQPNIAFELQAACHFEAGY
jgi:hypothetical protein